MIPALVLLSACQGLTGAMDPEAFKPSENPVTVDSYTRNDRLAQLARAQHPRILATYGGEYSDPKLERMVAKVVGSLTAESDNPNQTYRITILNSPNVNAFALPGGYLYVTRGLLALANDSAELAAVIAHEMAHVTANHGVARQQKEAEEAVASKVVSDVLGNSQDARVALIRNQLSLAQFSRNQELEADAIGIKAMARAGYDPFAAAAFLQSMARYADFRTVTRAKDANLDFLASHPNAPQRIELARRHARGIGAPGTGMRDRDLLLAGIDGLLYGDTPDEGFVRGNQFLHPKLGIAFSVPDGFVIDNSAAEVVASGDGDIAVRFDGVKLPMTTGLADYLRSGWIAGLDVTSVNTGTVAGQEAGFAKAQVEGWQFAITVIRVGDQVYRLLTAAPRTSTQLDRIAANVTSSFRVLSDTQKTALRPLRIRVITVKPGDTVASLAERMVGVDRKVELLRLINALPPGYNLSSGEKVKIITDQ
ncbi:M48 family metalloprotease [Limoniibacter endophyticus]